MAATRRMTPAPWDVTEVPNGGSLRGQLPGISFTKSHGPASLDLSVRPESFSMSRIMKRSLSLGLMAFCIACFGAGGRLLAGESQGHHAQPSAEAAKVTEHEGAPSEHTIDPVEPKPGLAVWTVVVFLVLMFVLTRFAWKPLLTALHNREAAPGALPARDGAGPQRKRGQSGRAPQADGQGRRRGAGHPRQGQARGPGGRRQLIKQAQGRGRAGQATSPARHRARHATRPWPKSGRRPPTWPSRSLVRCSPRK